MGEIISSRDAICTPDHIRKGFQGHPEVAVKDSLFT